LSLYNIENKFGKHYLAEKELIKKKYFKNLSNSEDVFKPSPSGVRGWIYDKFFRKKRF
jgi:hypothetical protein